MKKKILVISINYPSENNLYGDVFVHVRLKKYVEYFDIEVLSFFKEDSVRFYEGIQVFEYNSEDKIRLHIENANSAAILVHFAQGWFIQKLFKEYKNPILIWVHGWEAMFWYRILFDFEFKFKMLKKVLLNTWNVIKFRKYISISNTGNKNIQFIFVSNWMKRIVEGDLFINVRHQTIIPNPIDNSFFDYHCKSQTQSRSILLIRSFDSRKYANDIAIAAILKLSKFEIFKSLNFTIVGKGKYFRKLTLPLGPFPNVLVLNEFLNHQEIKKKHKDHGIFLCPTRQDAQGVSMCEAMSAGLVPITSDNTAIPEFVIHKTTGFLCDNVNDIVKSIMMLVESPGIFELMSKAASESIRLKCGIDKISKMEIQLISESIKCAELVE